MNTVKRLVTASLALGLSATSAFSAGSTNVIAITGDPSPDGNGTLSNVYLPSLNDAGQLAFVAELEGTTGGTTDSSALFRGTTQGLELIARSGQTLPGGDTLAFVGFTPSINEQGTVLGNGGVDHGGTFPEYVAFTGNGGPLSIFPRGGSPSPTGSGNQLVAASFASLTESGVAAYWGIYNGDTPEHGIFRRDPDGSLHTLMLSGAPSPRGGTYDNVYLETPHINDASQVAFTTPVTDNGQTHDALIRIDGTTVHELVREGDLLPDGITTINSLISFRNTPINNNGQIAFSASYSQPGKSGDAVFIAQGNTITTIASGTPAGAPGYMSNPNVFALNNNRTAGINAEFGGDEGIYVTDGTTSHFVAIEDTYLSDHGLYLETIISQSISLNDNGQVAFYAGLTETLNTFSDLTGLFFYDPADGLRLLYKTGDEFNGSTIATINTTGTDPYASDRASGSPASGLNNHGDLSFKFELEDGRTGVAVWSDQLVGDLDGDGFVGITDLNIILANWNQDIPPGNPLADPSGDDFVGIEDLNTVLGNWNAGTPPTNIASIPEPSTLAVLIPTLACLFSRHRGSQ